MSLVPVRRGIVRYEEQLGRFVEEGPDVTDAKAKLRELDPDISAWYDTVDQEWIVYWFNRKKNQDEFILRDTNLERAYQRMLKARNDAPGAETGDQMDDRLAKEQKALREADMEEFKDITREAGERLIHAFRKDGILDHENIYGPKPRKHLARKDVRVRERR